MAKNDTPAPAQEAKKLYSVNVAHRYKTSSGEEKVKFRELSIGFGNRKGGLGFNLPQGVSIDSTADIVIFEIEQGE